MPLPLEGTTATRKPRGINQWLGPILNPLSLCLGVDRRPSEEWKRSPTWPHMWGSNTGRVASIGETHSHPAKIIGTGIHPNGYAKVAVTTRRKNNNTMNAARIICDAWHGPAPFPGAFVDHINRNRRDDRPENLRWVTPAENAIRGTDHHNARLAPTDIIDIINRRAQGKTQASIAASYNLDNTTISRITRGNAWKHIAPEIIRPDAETKARDATLPLPKRTKRGRDQNRRSND